MRLAAASLPEVAWRSDFDVGPGEHVVTAIPGVRAEIAPLRNGW